MTFLYVISLPELLKWWGIGYRWANLNAKHFTNSDKLSLPWNAYLILTFQNVLTYAIKKMPFKTKATQF